MGGASVIGSKDPAGDDGPRSRPSCLARSNAASARSMTSARGFAVSAWASPTLDRESGIGLDAECRGEAGSESLGDDAGVPDGALGRMMTNSSPP